VKSICCLLGYTPQAYHKQTKHHLLKQVNEDLILQQVYLMRKEQPRCGTRKLLIMLQPFLSQHNINIGRDHFFNLLSKNKLLVRKTKRSVHPLTANITFTGILTWQRVLRLLKHMNFG